MGYVAGWAFSTNEKEESLRRRERYKELLKSGNIQIFSSSPGYAQREYRGTFDGAYTDEDILIFCDHGNTCFGGNVSKNGRTFTAVVYTD